VIYTRASQSFAQYYIPKLLYNRTTAIIATLRVSNIPVSAMKADDIEFFKDLCPIMETISWSSGNTPIP